MATEKQIEANRRNAQKSTGPRSAEGKARSRRNALKHGLAGRADILPPDDVEQFRDRLAGWMEDEQPNGPIETYLVETAALAATRLDRCARAEFAAVGKLRKQVMERWRRKQREAVRRQVRRLPADPARAVAKLESTAFGCLWLAEEWDDLDEALARDGRLDPDQADHAQRLLGLDPAAPNEPISPDLDAFRRLIQAASATPPDPDPVLLREAIAAELDRLDDLRETLWEETDGPALAEAINLASACDTSPAGTLRRRYETAATLDLHRAFAQLERRRKGDRSQSRRNRPSVATEPAPQPPNEPNSEAPAEPTPRDPSPETTRTPDEPTPAPADPSHEGHAVAPESLTGPTLAAPEPSPPAPEPPPTLVRWDQARRAGQCV